MKKLTLSLAFLLLASFLLFGCSSSAPYSAQAELPVSEFREPGAEYTVLAQMKDETGTAVAYETVEKISSDESHLPKRSLFVQFFAPDGSYRLTSACLGYFYKQETSVLSDLLLSGDEFSFLVDNSSYFSADRLTGQGSTYVYQPLCESATYTLEFATQYYYTQGTSRLLFRYTDSDLSSAVISTREPIDQNFNMALYESLYPSDYPSKKATHTLLCQVDSTEKRAVLSNSKLTYTLNFAAGDYTLTREYVLALLEDAPIAVSPSGKLQLFEADKGGAGDAIWSDLVLLEGDNIRYVGEYSLFSALFLSEDAFIVENTLSAQHFDVDTLQGTDLPGLTFEQIPRYDALISEKWIIGIAYDADNELILAAVRDFSDEMIPLQVSLLILNPQGLLLHEIATEYEVYPYHNNYPELCQIELKDGNATLSAEYPERSPVTVDYLNP